MERVVFPVILSAPVISLNRSQLYLAMFQIFRPAHQWYYVSGKERPFTFNDLAFEELNSM